MFILEALHVLATLFVQRFPFIYVMEGVFFVCVGGVGFCFFVFGFFITIDTKEAVARLGPL